MNWFEVFLLVTVIVLHVGVYFASPALKLPAFEPLRRWLEPLTHRLFPSSRMEPWLFEPIAAENLPPAQRRHFEDHTLGFTARGFTLLGDFVMRRDRQPSCTRYFLSPDRTAIGEVACYLNTYTAGCMSVLLDGFYIETANTTLDNLPPAAHGLQFCTLQTDDTATIIDHHTACVAQTAVQRGIQPAPLTRGDLQAVVNHGRQLSLHSLHHQGFLEELPAFLRNKQPQVGTSESASAGPPIKDDAI